LVLAIKIQICGKHIEIAAVGRELFGSEAEKLLGRQALGIGGGEEGVKIYYPPSGIVTAEAVPILAVAAQLATEDASCQKLIQPQALFLPCSVCGTLNVAVVAEAKDSVLAEIVPGTGVVRIDQRDIAIRGGEIGILFQCFGICIQGPQELFVRHLPTAEALGQGSDLLCKPLPPLGMELGHSLRYREKEDLLYIINTSLGQGIEDTHRVDLVTEEFHTHRLTHTGRENVHDTASDGELSHTLYQLASAIAAGKQLLQKGLNGQLHTAVQTQGTVQKPLLWHGTHGQGLVGANQKGTALLGQGVEQLDTLVLPLSGNTCDAVEGPVSYR
jgi:hypothetical protein